MYRVVIPGAVWVALTLNCVAQASLVDFEDISNVGFVRVGQTITSQGFTIGFAEFTNFNGTTYSSGSARLEESLSYINFTTRSIFTSNINMVFDFAGSIGRQSQMIIELDGHGGSLNLQINPDAGGSVIYIPKLANLADPSINGAAINGVHVAVDISIAPQSITLTGPIDKVLIGGQETFYDNISFVSSIPEPTSALLLATLALTPLHRKRRPA